MAAAVVRKRAAFSNASTKTGLAGYPGAVVRSLYNSAVNLLYAMVIWSKT